MRLAEASATREKTLIAQITKIGKGLSREVWIIVIRCLFRPTESGCYRYSHLDFDTYVMAYECSAQYRFLTAFNNRA